MSSGTITAELSEQLQSKLQELLDYVQTNTGGWSFVVNSISQYTPEHISEFLMSIYPRRAHQAVVMRISGDAGWSVSETNDVILLDGEGYEMYQDGAEFKLPAGKIVHLKKKIAIRVKAGGMLYLLVYFAKPK